MILKNAKRCMPSDRIHRALCSKISELHISFIAVRISPNGNEDAVTKFQGIF